MAPRIICLMYHRFASREDYTQKYGTERVYTVPTDSFEQQILYLKEHGYTFVTPDQVRGFITGESDLPQPSALFTFDDGCVSAKQQALPILQKYEARATYFVTTDPNAPVSFS